MKLHFIRHGQSEANVRHEVSNRGYKHPLTELGQEQAKLLASHMKDTTGISVVRLLTSPLMRAVQTAEILASTLALPFEITDALREYDCGILEGRSDEECWQIHSAARQAWLVDRLWDRRIEGGESFFDIRDRFVPFIDGLTRTYRDTTQQIVLIGHGGTYGCMLPLILKNIDFDTLDQRGFPNTGIVTAEWTTDGFLCRNWCGTPVL